ncbi:MAG: MBL fold metallo-hydrolase [Steroidobacteraceae bacterium]|nr:MBL fold metallo-hydrolase [Steroidobacteraceae bacterium]
MASAVTLSWGSAGLSAIGTGVAHARTKASALRATRLSDDLLLIEGAGGNVVAATSSDGVLLVDGGRAEQSSELLRLVAQETGRRGVQTLVNTHWHWDHTGSNEALGKAGATIIAHENTRLWLGTEVLSKWEDRTYPPLPARALPNKTFFYDTQHLGFGNETLEYGHLPQAHTDGDIYVFFPNQNVLVAGDVACVGRYPVVDYCTGGWLGGMVSGLKTLIAKADDNTRIIPGAGPVLTRADLRSQLDMCFTVLSKIGESYYKGETYEEFLASRPTRDFDAQWGNPDVFLRMAYDGAWYHVGEIRRVTR